MTDKSPSIQFSEHHANPQNDRAAINDKKRREKYENKQASTPQKQVLGLTEDESRRHFAALQDDDRERAAKKVRRKERHEKKRALKRQEYILDMADSYGDSGRHFAYGGADVRSARSGTYELNLPSDYVDERNFGTGTAPWDPDVQTFLRRDTPATQSVRPAESNHSTSSPTADNVLLSQQNPSDLPPEHGNEPKRSRPSRRRRAQMKRHAHAVENSIYGFHSPTENPATEESMTGEGMREE